MELSFRKEQEYELIDEGEGQVILLLHGLFGTLSNWNGVVNRFVSSNRVIIPHIPIYEMKVKKPDMESLVDFLERFIRFKQLKDVILIGNSLGGHIGLIYTLRQQANVRKLILTGSSGLFESSMGGSFPRRGSYEYIKERVEYTFFDPKTATKDLASRSYQSLNPLNVIIWPKTFHE